MGPFEFPFSFCKTPIASSHKFLPLGLRQSPGIEIVRERVVLREYSPSLWQLNRGSFRATPSGRNLWEEAPALIVAHKFCYSPQKNMNFLKAQILIGKRVSKVRCKRMILARK